MTRELHCLQYGEQEIRYEIVRRPRKTLEIAVEPDASVVIAAPEDATLDAIDARLRKRAAWVIRQQRYFAQFLPRTPDRRFVAGETHLYLGRQYRLKVVPHVQESVKLIRGFIVVQTHRPTRPEVTCELVEAWYRDRAHVKFRERIELCLGLFPDPEAFRPMGLIVRQTRQRWRSMSPAGGLLLNRRLVHPHNPPKQRKNPAAVGWGERFREGKWRRCQTNANQSQLGQ
ncbi:M48 family metallopeptidase [Maritimibacter fusiformis]|uniref:M48 family metallopeptidase n=1 Tax=Maritimibacter fusiformis TaxID=2603819 RepID=UPI001FE6D116|nr:YgjP-like metallopeptidase domain-containing protein [Maritimibacter fusiformis]